MSTLFSTWYYSPLITLCILPTFPRQKFTEHIGIDCKDTNFVEIPQILNTFFITFLHKTIN